MKTPPNSPFISVVVTAHNMEQCLGQCLESIQVQTLAEFECLVVNDGSSDSTGAVARSFASGDARFSVVDTPGLGAGGARNQGLSWVNAPYFMLLDGDDVFHPTMFEKLYRAAETNQADLAICDMQEMDDATGELTQVAWALKRSQLPDTETFGGWRELPGSIFAAFMGWPWDKLYRTELIRHEGLHFPEDLSNSEDGVFVFPALVCAERIAVVDEVLVCHRMQRNNTVSSSRAKEPYAFYEAVCRLKAFLAERGLWEDLGQDFLAWAFDWTLWNIETIGDEDLKRQMAKRLHDDGFPALELDQHGPEYFTGYPNSMARYTDLLHLLGEDQRDSGPLGVCRKLPFGEHRPWCFQNRLGRMLRERRLKKAPPSEW